MIGCCGTGDGGPCLACRRDGPFGKRENAGLLAGWGEEALRGSGCL